MTKAFLEFRDILWGLADGSKIPIKGLALDHLVNILNWVKDRPRLYSPALHPLLEQEAIYRKMIQFTAGEPIPCRGEDGRWFLVDSTTGDTIETMPKTDYTIPVDTPPK